MVQKNLRITVIAASVPLLVYIISFFLPFDLRAYGIRPRNIEGLWGIAFSPFLHANYGHLIANTGALFVLLFVALAFSRDLTLIAVLIIAVVGGGLVWVFSDPNTIHIGSSGIIFGLIGFLIFNGVFRREWSALVVSVVICLIYGGALLSLFYYIPGISWTGHFFGFVSGVLAAWLMKAKKKGRRTSDAKK
jgi:membrane associated rhomboid family serine protease